jgi:beta-hydroxylase
MAPLSMDAILLELITAKFIALYAFIASALFVHFRGKERLGFGRQLTDHSTFMAPYNCFIYMSSAVPNVPILDVKQYRALEPLREHWQTIRDEAARLYELGHIKRSEKYDDLAFNSFFKTGWKRFYLKWYDETLPSAKAMCPQTAALVDAIPEINAAMFTLLAPKSKLVRHRDPFAGSLRYHLGLVVPKSGTCRILVDGQPYHWQEGEDILFDETYIHVAENQTDEPRIILFCDVERPLNNPVSRAVSRFVNRHILKLTSTKNEDGEKVGAANKAFGGIYQVRLLTKRVKAYNERLYYALKYALIGAGLFLAFGLKFLG